MPTRTAAYDRICAAAVKHFALNGYDGASLNEIAGMVGIRKASLYSHFKNKDALYHQVLDDAVRIEGAFAAEMLASPVHEDGPGASYVIELDRRFETSVHLRFLLRNVYMPPVSQQTVIGDAYDQFLEQINTGFLRQLHEAYTQLSPTDAESYATAYLGIADALFVSLNYVGAESVESRRKALWRILSDSLKLHKQQ